MSPRRREHPPNSLPLNLPEQRSHSDRAGDYTESQHGFSARHREGSRSVDRSQYQRFDADTLEGHRNQLSYERRYDDSHHGIEPFPASTSRGRGLQAGSRGFRSDDRDHYDSYGDRTSHWDRTNSEQAFPSRSPHSPYSGRQQLVEPPTDLTRSMRHLSGGANLPTRPNNFDRPRSLVRNGVDYDEYENEFSKGEPLIPRRGGSLLNRLSLGISGEREGVTTSSFRDIRDVIGRRDADQGGTSEGDTAMIDHGHGGMDRRQDMGLSAVRGRRRIKLRRVKKGGQ